MKIQGIAVMFAIIILPVVIILSYYIQYSIDTIARQTAYDTKLIDSTHDAMASFELNTANEDLSSVSDSLRSIIDAATNVFFNTLATNLGMSNANQSYVQSYVPAILYTLYDGYYIYSPTRVPEILTKDNEQVIYVGNPGVDYEGIAGGIGIYKFTGNPSDIVTYDSIDNKYEYGQMLYKNSDGTYSTVTNDNTVYNQDYVLKSYMPYSARYKTQAGETLDFDLTINYTLDNYLTVEGYIEDVYYSKTGYLIGANVVESIMVDGNPSLLTYNQDEAEEICLSGQHTLQLKIKPFIEDGENRVASSIEYNFTPVIEDGIALNSIQIQERLDKLYEKLDNLYAELAKAKEINDTARMATLEAEINTKINQIQNLELQLSNLKAIAYYVKAQIFSNWIYENLNFMQSKHVENTIENVTKTEKEYIFHDFSKEENTQIFNAAINPEKEDSPFYSHKLNVIRNSIQYNLNLALSAYNTMARELDINMPIMTDDEWDKILNNISIVSFMQGLNCGMKVYNNYAIVSSTNNELTVIPSEIYYTKKSEYNTADTSHIYHRIDCPELIDDEYISFVSKEIKYDKIFDKSTQKYRYDHRNNACYSCIVGANYLKKIGTDAGGHDIMGYSDEILISTLSANKQKEYFRALAKERQSLYKTNALTESNGYEVLYTAPLSSPRISFNNGNDVKEINVSRASSLGINKIKEIEIAFKNIESENRNAPTATFKAILNILNNIDENLVVNLEQAAPQTIRIPVHVESIDELNKIELMKMNPDDKVEFDLLSVRVIYE